MEYNISYLYHSLHSFFARDNVALPGFAKYFDDASTEEREHARKLMYVQSVRGGRVKLLSIGMPEMEVRIVSLMLDIVTARSFALLSSASCL